VCGLPVLFLQLIRRQSGDVISPPKKYAMLFTCAALCSPVCVSVCVCVCFGKTTSRGPLIVVVAVRCKDQGRSRKQKWAERKKKLQGVHFIYFGASLLFRWWLDFDMGPESGDGGASQSIVSVERGAVGWLPLRLQLLANKTQQQQQQHKAHSGAAEEVESGTGSCY